MGEYFSRLWGSFWEGFKNAFTATLDYFRDKSQQENIDPFNQMQPEDIRSLMEHRQENNSINQTQQTRVQETAQQPDKANYNSYGYTQEQIIEILRNHKIEELKKSTTDQILQQHPYAMDYSRGYTREEIADLIRTTEIAELKTEHLYGKHTSAAIPKNYGYTPEQIDEILKNHKIEELKKSTPGQTLQQHPYAMDYSCGYTQEEIANLIRANKLTGVEISQSQPLSVRREKRGEPSEERIAEARKLEQKMLGKSNHEKTRDIA